ncbi:MAG: nuclear transport factor 2 family protein [Bacteroidia bacterium]|nr:nuclear transport factor 2 family protein [Bacteroidia bacterium]
MLDQILAEDFEMTDNSGERFNKADELDWIKKNPTSYDSFYYEIKRMDIYDNGTAIVGGTGHIQTDTLKSIYQSSNILILRDGQWKAVLSHVSGFRNI